MVGNYTQMQHFIVQDHLTFGWYVFAGCLLPLIFISRKYFSDSSNNQIIKSFNNDLKYKKSNMILVSTCLVLICFSLMQFYLPSRFSEDYRYQLPNFTQYQWVIKNKSISPNWQPISHGASSESFNFYINDESKFQVYVADYKKQKQGEEMIFVENALYNKHRWNEVTHYQITEKLSHKINLVNLERNGNRGRSIAYVYFVNNKFIADKKVAKLNEVLGVIKGEPGTSIIAITIDYENTKRNSAIGKLKIFTEELLSKTKFKS